MQYKKQLINEINSLMKNSYNYNMTAMLKIGKEIRFLISQTAVKKINTRLSIEELEQLKKDIINVFAKYKKDFVIYVEYLENNGSNYIYTYDNKMYFEVTGVIAGTYEIDGNNAISYINSNNSNCKYSVDPEAIEYIKNMCLNELPL